ncbi:MAG: hypothetical protein A3H14_00425 [Candidatus Doudnabacteria bacterium RIFCSPLOWO2_12_FULL_49_8]|nr:MAG: hypothetical protein A3H14_00425 [Candidatus Doudnabacteria bacterium RIFCSPLOWO2_12_FULL_49_8]
MYFVLILLCLVALYSLANGAIYVPTDKRSVEIIVQSLNVRPGMRVADLGSGDGRIVIALAMAGANAVGFENNPVLFVWSWIKIRRLGLNQRAKIYWRSFWRQDLSPFDAVVVFGMSHIMLRLQRKLNKELRPDALIISNVFKFPNWQPVGEVGMIKIYRIGG